MVVQGRAQGQTGHNRGGGRLCLIALVLTSVGLSFSSSADAANGVISPQYQAKNGDITARTGPIGPAADPSGGDTPRIVAGPDHPHAPQGIVTWYRAENRQYQFLLHIEGNHGRGNRSISTQIASVTDRGRRLVQLGIALGLVYVAFLVWWFWWTQTLPHGARTRRVVRY